MTAPPDRFEAGLADRYAIERLLGSGGMATVYLARDLKHQRSVALKVLRPELAAVLGPERFLREIQIAAQLNHPHILPLFDSGETAGWLWYAMPLVEGESLRERLNRERQLPLEDALAITLDVADALGFAHSRGIVHRDIKPENILLSGGHALVADLGIARALAPEVGKLTETGMVVGTPGYMSPEQGSGNSVVDARSDLYALGSVLYEMLAGEPPYTGPTTQAILTKQLMDPVPSVRRLRDAVPIPVDAALRRALAKAPADRFATAAYFSAALTEPAKVSARGRRAVVAIAALAFLGVAFGVTLTRGKRSGQGAAGVPQRIARTVDPEAYDLYLRGRYQLARRRQANATQSVALFSQAISRDSTFALAWAGLARALQLANRRQFLLPGVPQDSLVARELAASQRAIELDSTNSYVWLAYAWVAWDVDPTERTAVLRAARRALAADSLNAEALHLLGLALEETGDPSGAVRMWRRAVVLNAAYIESLAFLGGHYWWARRYDSAAVWADSAVLIEPTYLLGRQFAGLAALARGRLAEAEAHFSAARRLSAGSDLVQPMSGLAQVAVAARDRTRAVRLLAEAEAITDSLDPPLHSAVDLADGYATLGDTARALRWLEAYPIPRDLHFQMHLRLDPPLDPLRNLPRFRRLLSS